MALKSRSALAVLCSAVIFAVMIAPYAYLTSGLLTGVQTAFALLVLMTCSAVLASGFIGPSQFTARWPRAWQAVLIIFSFACVCLLLDTLAFMDIGEKIQQWYYLLRFVANLSLLGLVVELSTRPSRLERILTRQFNRFAYRAFAYLLLMVMLLAITFTIYRFHRFQIQSMGG